MADVFVISDTHFGHENILKFTHDGKPLRPFSSLTEMHVHIIEKWNEVVKPGDKVYHLGDVAFSREGLKLMGVLNGKKRLIRGNHDLYRTSMYTKYFYEIYGVRQINGIWLTHVPMHPHSVEPDGVKGNIHGHLHANILDNKKYKNVSVEAVGYTPVNIEEVFT